MGRHSVVEDPAPPSPDGRLGTGHHRAVGRAAARRRIAPWPLVTGALVVLLAAGLLGWGWAANVLDSRAEAQAKGCAEGDSTMEVVAAPGVAQPVMAAAVEWNQARTVVHAHCVHIDVRAVGSAKVYDALTGSTSPGSIGGLPAAWIPESSWTARLATRADLIGSPPEPVTTGYSYVGLGGQAVDEVTIRAAQVFRDFLGEPAQQAGFADAGLS